MKIQDFQLKFSQVRDSETLDFEYEKWRFGFIFAKRKIWYSILNPLLRYESLAQPLTIVVSKKIYSM